MSALAPPIDIACCAALPSSMQPGMPNIDASMPHMSSVPQQLGKVKPMTLRPGQRLSLATGFAHGPPIDIPHVLVASSAQHALMKPPKPPPGDVQVLAPHWTGSVAPGTTPVPARLDATLPPLPLVAPRPLLAALPDSPVRPARPPAPGESSASSSPQPIPIISMLTHATRSMREVPSLFMTSPSYYLSLAMRDDVANYQFSYAQS
jgi:hypothetical protein